MKGITTKHYPAHPPTDADAYPALSVFQIAKPAQAQDCQDYW